MHLKMIHLKSKRLQILRKLPPCSTSHSSQGLISLNEFQVFKDSKCSLRRKISSILKLEGRLTFSIPPPFPMTVHKKSQKLPSKIPQKVPKLTIADGQGERSWRPSWKMTRNSRRELILSQMHRESNTIKEGQCFLTRMLSEKLVCLRFDKNLINITV